MKKAVIVVPIYKEKPNHLEDISLRQLFAVMSDYDISYIAPGGLSLESYQYGLVIIERFKPDYFKGLRGYTELMLSQDLYERFSDYEYMLLYQTDAFVFSDRLAEFMEMGYDYIGAPIRDFGWDRFHVGNGGFSLRKIEAHIRILRDKDKIIAGMSEHDREVLNHAEDYFWGYCGWRKDVKFSVPTIWDAARFAVERDVGHGFRRIATEGLPFGTHHWHIMNYETWRSYIEGFGYKLPEIHLDNWETLDSDMYQRRKLFLHHLIKHRDRNLIGLCRDIISESQSVIIWGFGHDGKKCVAALEHMGITIKCIWDKTHCGNYGNIPITTPQLEEANDGNLIVIASTRYETEMADELLVYKKERGTDFITSREFENQLIEKLPEIYPGICGITERIIRGEI